MSVTAGDSGVAARVRAAVEGLRRAQREVLCSVSDLDDSDLVGASGYRSTGRMLQDLAHVDPCVAKRWLAQSKAVLPRTTLTGEPLPPALPATADAFAHHALGEDHIRVIGRAMDAVGRVPDLEPGRADDAERILAQAATTLAPHAVERIARRLLAHLDPDGPAPLDPPPDDDELSLRTDTRDGSLALAGRVHAASDADLIREVLDALSTPAGPDDNRSLSARRAAALLEVFLREAAAVGLTTTPGAAEQTGEPTSAPSEKSADGEPIPEPGDPGPFAAATRPGGRPLIAVTMDYTWLRLGIGHGLLDSEATISPGEARRLACDAGIVPMILGSTGQPLDVGRLSYTVPDGLRRALAVRDRGCTFPGCTRRPRRCHAHHIEHWLDDGDTCLQNLTLLCRYHHQLVHHDHWQIAMHDGRPWYTPPAFIDPERRPRPGGPHPPDL